MSGDYKALGINHPKISYFEERSDNGTEWLDQVINKIEDLKYKIPEITSKIIQKEFYPYRVSNPLSKKSLDALFKIY